MLRTIVTVLVGLPLLMPPGMCVCQFGSRRYAAATVPTASGQGGTASVQGRVPVKASPRKCICCKNCGRAIDESSAAMHSCGSDRGIESDQDRSTPVEDRHAPGCPALKTVDQSKWSEPLNIPLITPDAALGSSLALAEGFRPSLPSTAGTPTQSAQPLYLTLRTLLI